MPIDKLPDLFAFELWTLMSIGGFLCASVLGGFIIGRALTMSFVPKLTARYFTVMILAGAGVIAGGFLAYEGWNQYTDNVAAVVENHLDETYGVSTHLDGSRVLELSENPITVLDDGEALKLVQTDDRIVLLTPDDQEAPRVGA